MIYAPPPPPHSRSEAERLLTMAEVCDELRVSRRYLLRERKAGRITPVMIGRRNVRFTRAEVRRYLASLQAFDPVAPTDDRGARGRGW